MAGYVDLQVNGSFGVDFNGPPWSDEAMEQICIDLQAIGVSKFLPTLITASVESTCHRLHRLQASRSSSSLAQSMIPGFHIEGPFLSGQAGYVGAHPTEHILPASVSIMQRLLDAAGGLVRLVTLAPEQDPTGEVTKMLVKANIRVSAGHTNASMDQLKAAIQHGVSGFTHLGNATPPSMPRHDNIIQRVLALREHFTIMLIADGHHLPLFVLKNILDLIGFEKTIVVSDAISAAGMTPGRYRLCEQEVIVGEDGSCKSIDGSYFVGSAATMNRMNQILVDRLGLTDAECRKLLSTNPLHYLGLTD